MQEAHLQPPQKSIAAYTVAAPLPGLCLSDVFVMP
ncbi:Protein of unknown function [Pyronema omphalodes CBS 100304]|uniref:Uncharacterized protein n=1 Tax=Pyronema omphalodes (strain CBS 100304) TaxID=1076935 RepID=U4LNC9_PYROM|nr:Protein of unknown function [Pyronema omphalodes CBS 100304]